MTEPISPVFYIRSATRGFLFKKSFFFHFTIQMTSLRNFLSMNFSGKHLCVISTAQQSCHFSITFGGMALLGLTQHGQCLLFYHNWATWLKGVFLRDDMLVPIPTVLSVNQL